MKKVCSRCKLPQSPDNFGRRKATTDGLASACKSCTRAYDKARHYEPHRVEARKAYQQTEQYKSASDRARKEWRERNREKQRAHSAVARALKKGIIERRCCEVCCDPLKKTEAHHDDYSKPLDVIWLCDEHHKLRHIELRLEARPWQDMQWGGINAQLGIEGEPLDDEETQRQKWEDAAVPF